MDVFALSALRANIIAWLPIQKTDSVCYMGGEEDMAAKKLREMSGALTCAARAQTIPFGGRYDYIISLGRAKKEEIKLFHGCLADTGKLVFAAANAYGLKYLAGVKEYGSGQYFGSVEAAEGSLACTKEEIEESLEEAGFDWQQFYYPFPDHHFAIAIFSDNRLPKKGELIDPVGNFDAERLVLFDEAKAADVLAARGKFADFSSSYLAIAGMDAAGSLKNSMGEEIAYVKFSNDRGNHHNIRTYLTKSKDGAGRHIVKTADCIEAQAQIVRMKQAFWSLQELYAGTKFVINTYTERDGGAEFAFVSGHTLEEELDALLAEGEYEKASEKMSEVFSQICSCKNVREFCMTEEFIEVFGRPNLPAGLLAPSFSDIDMIFPNIIAGEDGSWTVVDYEWSFPFPVPLHFILYRNIRYYADTTAQRRQLNPALLYEKAGISSSELAAYAQMEEAFQSYVLGGHTPLRQLYKEAGKPAYHVTSLLHVIDGLERRSALQIYFDRGGGFSESCVATYRSKALDGTYRLEIPIGKEVKQLRIDPGSCACTVEINRLCFKGDAAGTMLDFISNGHKMDKNRYLFDTDDPNILLNHLPAGDKTLLLDMRIDSMSLAAAEWIAPKIDAKYRLKKVLGKA